MSSSDFRAALESVDWEFRHQRRWSPWPNWHAWHWYPASTHHGVAAAIVRILTEPGDTVLDPMCGSGTVLAAAAELGRNAVGFDVSPVASEITGAKLIRPTSSSLDLLEDLVRGQLYGDLFATRRDRADLAEIPNAGKQGEWYHAATLADLAEIWRIIHTLDEEDTRLAGRACFSAVLLAVSSQAGRWRWVCDNVKPRDLVYRDAGKAFLKKLKDYRKALARSSELSDPVDGTVLAGDALEMLETLPSESAQLVATSLPCLNAHDYLRSQRLSLLWSRDWFIRERGDPVDSSYHQWRHAEIGARFKRSSPRAHALYLDAIQRVLEECGRVLAPGGHACLLLRESYVYQPTVDITVERTIGVGFELVFRRDFPTRRPHQRPSRIGEPVLFVVRKPFA